MVFDGGKFNKKRGGCRVLLSSTGATGTRARTAHTAKEAMKEEQVSKPGKLGPASSKAEQRGGR